MTASTLRYYESIGLLPPAERCAGRRVYEPGVLTTLGVIKAARSVGFSLDEIRELLDSGASGKRLAAIAARKLPEIDAGIARAMEVRSWMGAASRCRCRTLEECGLFDQACAA